MPFYFDDMERAAADVADALRADPEFCARARASRPAFGSAYLEGESGLGLAAGLLDALAAEIATAVAGDGFGVGPTLYGVATADLRTLRVTDDPNAPPPERG